MDLLREYAVTGAESAFAELVRCYLDLVYSAALRRCGGDAIQAAEVAQCVFTELARRARSSRRTEAQAVLAAASLGGWLYRHTTFVAATAMRGEARRRHREETAMQLQAQTDSTDWSQVAPILEDAMAELVDRDRDALVLRFFEKESFARVGARLGSSEDAARVRVDRALDRLREHLARRGVTSTAAALASSLSAFGVTPAPAGLATLITTAAVALPVAGIGTMIGTTMGFRFMKSKLALGILGSVLLTTALLREHRNVNRLTDDNAALRQQLTALSAATTPDAADEEELGRQRQLHVELLQLRGEVARLRRDLTEATARLTATAAMTETNPVSAQVEIEGQLFEVPDAALKSMGLFLRQNGGAIFEAPVATLILKRLKEAEGVDLLGSPKLTTLVGRNGRMIIGDTGESDYSYGRVRSEPPEKPAVIIDITPMVKPDSPQLELSILFGYDSGHWRTSRESGTAPADASLAFGDPTFGPWQNQSFKLRDGQTVALRQPAQRYPGATNSPEGRSLFVLVTATLIDPAGSRLFPDPEAQPTAAPTAGTAP